MQSKNPKVSSDLEENHFPLGMMKPILSQWSFNSNTITRTFSFHTLSFLRTYLYVSEQNQSMDEKSKKINIQMNF